ncbi:LOW QUALITY PROTEIN: Protein of unknown function PDDEXK-like, partial [Dillenia turbinata]
MFDKFGHQGTFIFRSCQTNSCNKKEVKIVIELNLRGEFEIASQGYNHLINQLPEVYVDKAERLQALIKNFVQRNKKVHERQENALGTLEETQVYANQVARHRRQKPHGLRQPQQPFVQVAEFSYRPPRPKASLLSTDL